VSEETERVTQLWPASIKAKVQDRVGQRGVTRYTLEAVREKLARDEAQDTVKEAIGETVDLPVAPVVATPVAVVEREEPVEPEPVMFKAEPEPHISKLIGDETRGADVVVETSSTGAAAEYSSSRERVEAMLAKAAGLGLKKAAELPIPPKPVVEEIAVPDEVAESPEEEFDPNAYDEPTPDDQPTLQETLTQINTVPVSALPETVPVPSRVLDDIEVDF
jgi:hypothetical protein